MYSRQTLFTVLFIFCILTMIRIYFVQPDFKQEDPYMPGEPPQVPEYIPQTHILLYSEGRSGSTWLSSFFFSRPDVYFTFEPLFLTDQLKERRCHEDPQINTACNQEILSSLFSCSFRTSRLTVQGRDPTYQKHEECDCYGKCTCNNPRLERMCKAAQYNVAKVILLKDLNDLKLIMDDPLIFGFNIKIVHLVRNAFPLVKSRMGPFGTIDGEDKHSKPKHAYFTVTEYGKLHHNLTRIRAESKTLCARMLNAVKLGDNPPPWLTGRYMRITHELLSTNPLDTAKQIFQFAGINWDRNIQALIANSTSNNSGGYYGTRRLSSSVPVRWKGYRDITAAMIRVIAESCEEYLQYVGYEYDADEIINDVMSYRKTHEELEVERPAWEKG